MGYEFRRATLDNGLTVIGEVDSSAHTCAAGCFVRTGARDESPSVMGVSHFLEHMMFKGTESLSADALNRAFDDLGAQNNAYTSTEMTCFYASVLPERFAETTELIATMMRPALRTQDFDTEKGVILEEIAMYRDNPFWVLFEAAVEKYFTGHPLAHRVLGTEETIKALARDQMESYFRSRYSADNTTFAVAGRVDFDATVELLRRSCGTWERTNAARDPAVPTPRREEFTLRDAKVSRGYLLGLAPAPAVDDERRYAAALLAEVLGAADNSRLHWAIIEPGIAEEAQAGYSPHEGMGQFTVFAAGDPARLDEIWSIMRREITALIDTVTEDDLARLRSKLATGATVAGERPGGRMHRLGRMWTSTGTYLPIEEEVDRIGKVRVRDVRDVHDAFPPMPHVIGRLIPDESAASDGGRA